MTAGRPRVGRFPAPRPWAAARSLLILHAMLRPTRSVGGPGPLLLAAAVVAMTGCGGAPPEEDSVRRGDLAFAVGKYDQALAEYRLAVRQGADDARALARVAHTYAMLGRVDDAGAFYAEAAARDSSYTDQAVSDLMRLARDAQARRDRFAMATAVETVLRLRPGVGVSDLAIDLARHYFRGGEYGRALPFYLTALTDPQHASNPETVFEVGQAYEEIGDCPHALPFFERFRQMARPNQLSEVDWHIGTCSLRLARELRTAPEPSSEALRKALSLVERMLEVGEPSNMIPQAWFEKGLILSDLGDCGGAMDALAQVRTADSAGSLAVRALNVYDEIRFGQALRFLRGGRCR